MRQKKEKTAVSDSDQENGVFERVPQNIKKRVDTEDEETDSENDDVVSIHYGDNLAGRVSESEELSGEKWKPLNSSLNYEELSSDEEFYTFQCPTDFDTKDLLNLKFSCSDSNQDIDMKSGKNCIIDVVKEMRKEVACVLPSRKGPKAILVPLQGHIIVTRNIRVPKFDDFEEEMDQTIEKNDDLLDVKLRHPLLGTDWNDYIEKSNAAIIKQLPIKIESIKKDKKRKRHDSDINVTPKHKKKKKHGLT